MSFIIYVYLNDIQTYFIRDHCEWSLSIFIELSLSYLIRIRTSIGQEIWNRLFDHYTFHTNGRDVFSSNWNLSSYSKILRYKFLFLKLKRIYLIKESQFFVVVNFIMIFVIKFLLVLYGFILKCINIDYHIKIKNKFLQNYLFYYNYFVELEFL